MADFVNRAAFSTSVLTTSSDTAFERARHHVREWLSHQANEFNLEPLTGTFALEQRKNDAARLLVQATDDSLSFAFAHKDQHDVNTSWHVLGAISARDGNAQVDVEVAAEGAAPPLVPPLGMPSFMVRIVNDVGLLDVRPLSTTPIAIKPHDAGAFGDFLRDRKRELPVVAFSQPLPLTADEIDRISRRIAGAAHIALIEADASYILSDRIGRSFSVYQGAVRVYPPTLPRSPYQIKLYFPATIQKYNAQERRNGPFGTIRFADVLVRSTLDRRMWPAIVPETLQQQPTDEVEAVAESLTMTAAAVIAVPKPEEPQKPSLEVSEAMSAIVIEAKKVEEPPEVAPFDVVITPKTDQIFALRKQIDDLRAENERLQAALDNANDEWFNATTELERLQNIESPMTITGVTEEDASVLSDIRDAFASVKQMIERITAAEAARRQLRDENEEQRRDISKLQWTLEGFQRSGDSVGNPETVNHPTDYREIGNVERYLDSRHGGCIVLHPNARESLAAGLFADSDHVIAMLDLLGRPHHDMKVGGYGDGAYKQFHRLREALHVKYGAVLSESSIGEYGHHYDVMWDGKRIGARDIGHIRDLGTTYAPERMAAVYFFWDQARKATVITSGPRKLPTPADGT